MYSERTGRNRRAHNRGTASSRHRVRRQWLRNDRVIVQSPGIREELNHNDPLAQRCTRQSNGRS